MSTGSIRAQAPGKLFYSGEYAVLMGGPAIVRAIDRVAIVSATPTQGNIHRVEAHGLSAPGAAFRVDENDHIEFLDGAAERHYTLFSCVVSSFLDKGYKFDTAFDWSLDTQGFFGLAGKLGFGSSAALAVALGGVLAAIADCDDATFAIDGHHDFQSGRGSGIDLRVAESGGVQCAYAASERPLAPANWPSWLAGAVVDTKQPSATISALSRFAQVAESAAGRSRLESLLGAAMLAAENWCEGTEALLQGVENFASELSALDQEFGLGIYAGGHSDICALGADLPVVYKPSGAGGGDQGVVLSQDVDALREFRSRLAGHGFNTIAVETNAQGLQVTKQ